MRSIQSVSDDEIKAFQRKILRFYRKHGRQLPWRSTTDPYCITIAEIMLQQTQVERVVPKYQAWIDRWPGWPSLSHASTEQLLRAWSGLGYNRRALSLGKLAKALLNQFNGQLPQDPALLETLPGIGPYTSRAILIFAFNRPLATVDTNIRRVLIHQFCLSPSTPLESIRQFSERLVPKRLSRDWHNGLMDYSRLMLPKQLANIPPLSRQTRFEGSARQVRGEIIRMLLKGGPVSFRRICRTTGRDLPTIKEIANGMAKDGLILVKNGQLTLPR